LVWTNQDRLLEETLTSCSPRATLPEKHPRGMHSEPLCSQKKVELCSKRNDTVRQKRPHCTLQFNDGAKLAGCWQFVFTDKPTRRTLTCYEADHDAYHFLLWLTIALTEMTEDDLF